MIPVMYAITASMDSEVLVILNIAEMQPSPARISLSWLQMSGAIGRVTNGGVGGGWEAPSAVAKNERNGWQLQKPLQYSFDGTPVSHEERRLGNTRPQECPDGGDQKVSGDTKGDERNCDGGGNMADVPGTLGWRVPR